MMQFWGAEVKSGGSVKVEPGEEKVVHLSQACLGEVKKDKGNEFVRIFVQKDGMKFVLGILSSEKFPQINLDLVFEDAFELSHDCKHGSVHFTGYKAVNPSQSMSDDDESDDDLEEPVSLDVFHNGKPEAKESKLENAEGKPKVKLVEPVKDLKKDEDDETEDDEDEDDESDEDEEDDEDMPTADGSEDEDDSEEDESDEETPKKPEPSKKRPGESSSKAPAEKKAKFATPQQKTDGKKVSGHVATPHPAKQAAKTPANTDKSNKQQTPKSGGSFACSPCNRSFGSEQALQAHSKAKHGAK